MEQLTGLMEKLRREGGLEHREWVTLLEGYSNGAFCAAAADLAQQITLERFGNLVFTRGIVEFSNCCVNDCLYCGIRCSNKKAERYRLNEEDILACCRGGFACGMRTFVLQSGEDPMWKTDRLCALVKEIKKEFPECAVTLSVGELPREAYQQLFDAGADRYLLRHESASEEHFTMIHPPKQQLASRMRCLKDLKEIGFQTGCGFMVGTPGQNFDHLAQDMEFISRFKPHMVGIGPFIPHCDTPFAKAPGGSVELTLLLLSLCRIMAPELLLPATTALGTASADGRLRGIFAGANVIMPNISPGEFRSKYALYNNKSNADAGNNSSFFADLKDKLAAIGRQLHVGRGDYGEKRSC